MFSFFFTLFLLTVTFNSFLQDKKFFTYFKKNNLLKCWQIYFTSCFCSHVYFGWTQVWKMFSSHYAWLHNKPWINLCFETRRSTNVGAALLLIPNLLLKVLRDKYFVANGSLDVYNAFVVTMSDFLRYASEILVLLWWFHCSLGLDVE